MCCIIISSSLNLHGSQIIILKIVYSTTYSTLPLIWDLSDAELMEVPDYRVIFGMIVERNL